MYERFNLKFWSHNLVQSFMVSLQRKIAT